MYTTLVSDYFNLQKTLECGQVFRYKKIEDNHYRIIIGDRMFHLVQKGDEIWCPAEIPIEEVIFLRQYLDLERDYKSINKYILDKNPELNEMVEISKGIHILKQDPWEMLISFIISQSKNIPNIQLCIETLCQKFGTHMYGDIYAFPTPEQLSLATIEDIRECKVGYRDKFIYDACQKVINGEIKLYELYDKSYNEIKTELMKIKGVGPKVANCVILFAYNKLDSFPVDVWIKRGMESLYFNGEKRKESEIESFGNDKFGEYGGIAQQYIFYGMRKKSKK